MNYIVIFVLEDEVNIEKFDYYDDAIARYNENKDFCINAYVTDIIKGG